MDLWAYMRIESLDSLAKANGIVVPRLRGYRLMSEENPISPKGYSQLFHDCAMDAIEMLCTSDPFWDPNSDCSIFNYRSDHARKYYLKYGLDEDGCRVPVAIRWDRIHGKKRRILKHEIKKNIKLAVTQYALWDKYAGKENVLYIHSRMGGNNWAGYEGKEALMAQPWFLDRVDDWWDGTYCDFYAKLNPDTVQIVVEASQRGGDQKDANQL